MFSRPRYRGRMKPYGSIGWMEILLILAGVVVIRFQPHPGP